MQASATVPPSTAAAPPPHARVGRNSSIAPQPGATPASADPAGFEASLVQAQATPATAVTAAATAPAGQDGAGKTPAPAAQPEPVAVTATPVPVVNKAANTAPGTPVTEPEQDKQPAIPHEPSEIALLPAALPPAQPAALPGPATTASAPTLLSGADTVPAAAIAVAAGDAPPPQPAAGQAAQATQVSGSRLVALPAAAASLHPGFDRPVAAAERAATAQAPDLALDTIAAINATLPSPMPPLATMATIAVIHAVPPPSIRPTAAAEQPASSPAAQVGPALASFAISAAQPNAPQHLIIRLDPAELGRVQVRIERTPDGPARVELVVERPDTLLMLLRDQPQLHRALDLAGVPAPDRTLQFQLAPAATPGATTPQFNADSGPGQHRPGQPKQHGANNANTAISDDPTIRPAAAFRRAGVNIMA